MQSAVIWLMLTALAGPGGGTSAEICVEYERDNRLSSHTTEASRGLAAPETFARARDYLARNRLPKGEFEVADFLGWMPDRDTHPPGEAMAVRLESARHPSDANVALVRVAVTTEPLQVVDPLPVHLVVLVNVAQTMRSVPTRAYPLLGDQLPDLGADVFSYRRVDRLALTRSILHELRAELPQDTVIALAAFDHGAAIALPPTSVSDKAAVDAAINTLEPGLVTDGKQGLGLMLGLVDRMRSFCGDTHVLVISDGPTGLGGDPEEAFKALSAQASHGVTVHTMMPAVGMRRIPQLERLAWVGYGSHHYVDTLGDGVIALRDEFTDGRTAVRDVSIDVQFDPKLVLSSHRIGDDRPWLESSLPHSVGREVLYEVALREGSGDQPFVKAKWHAGSPISGDWTLDGTAQLAAGDLHRVFREATPNLRMAWVAAGFADALNQESHVDLDALYEMASEARRDGVTQDVELMGLIDRFKRVATE